MPGSIDTSPVVAYLDPDPTVGLELCEAVEDDPLSGRVTNDEALSLEFVLDMFKIRAAYPAAPDDAEDVLLGIETIGTSGCGQSILLLREQGDQVLLIAGQNLPIPLLYHKVLVLVKLRAIMKCKEI